MAGLRDRACNPSQRHQRRRTIYPSLRRICSKIVTDFHHFISAHAMPHPYQTLSNPTHFCYEEKRSRFLAFIFPVATKEEGFAHFESIRQKYPDARHHCWAYLLGDPEQALAAGFNDDGEPGGTAGKPMLNVLMQRKVGNVFAVVVRYFGGVKLGAGGLTRAYGQAISGALDVAEFKLVVQREQLIIEIGFSLEQKVRNLLQHQEVIVQEVQYSEASAILKCDCPANQIEFIKTLLLNQAAGKVKFVDAVN